MVTVLGRVTEIEAVVAPPAVEPPPEIPLATRGGKSAEAREVVEPPKNWVHVHITLELPSSGELEINTPEQNASGMLVVGGRCRVILSS